MLAIRLVFGRRTQRAPRGVRTNPPAGAFPSSGGYSGRAEMPNSPLWGRTKAPSLLPSQRRSKTRAGRSHADGVACSPIPGLPASCVARPLSTSHGNTGRKSSIRRPLRSPRLPPPLKLGPSPNPAHPPLSPHTAPPAIGRSSPKWTDTLPRRPSRPPLSKHPPRLPLQPLRSPRSSRRA
jgi:hypothetical protein